MSEQSTDFIPCMLIPLQQHYLLLPNTTLAEVIPMPQLDEVNGKPQYWVGQCNWHSWQIPVIDLEGMVQDNPADTADANKLCVIRGINDSSSVSVYGLPCYGVPQLFYLTESALKPVENADESNYLHSQIQIGNNIAYIPNLDNIESALN